MRDATERFLVTRRFRVTWSGAWLFAASLVFTVTGTSLVVRAQTTADVVLGAMAVLLFGGGGILAATPVLSRRPALVLDDAGVRVLAPWPRSASNDLVMPWRDITRIQAATQVVPYRGNTTLLHYLVFVPPGEPERAFRPPAPWKPGHAVRVSATWDRTVEEVVAEAQRRRPDLPFEDRRLPHGPPG